MDLPAIFGGVVVFGHVVFWDFFFISFFMLSLFVVGITPSNKMGVSGWTRAPDTLA